MDAKKAFGKIQNAMMDLDDYSEELIAIGEGLGMKKEDMEKEYPKLHPDWEGQTVEYDEEKDEYIQLDEEEKEEEKDEDN